MPRSVLIYNPVAGGRLGRGRVDAVAAALGAAFAPLEVLASGGPGGAEPLARAAAAAGAEWIFVLGGDGTLRECAAGALGSAAALGFLGGGTANVMRRPLALDRDPVLAARGLARGAVIEIDVGLFDGRPFLMQASVGIDAQIVGDLTPPAKRLLRSAAVVRPAFVWLARYGFPRFAVHADGEPLEATFAAVCNIPFYGGHVRLAPAADWRDGWLDLVLWRGGRLPTLGLAARLALGSAAPRGLLLRRVRRVEVAAAPGLAAQLDGDRLPPDALPAKISLAPQRLRLLVPRRGR